MDSWTLTASEPAAGHLYLANGYASTALSWSAGVLDGPDDSPCYVRAVYNDSGEGGIDRLASLPSWSRIRYAAPARLESYSRKLDIRHGVLHTTFHLREERGTVRIEQTMLVSRADRHQAAIRMTVTPDFDGDVEFVCALNTHGLEDVDYVDAAGDDACLWLLSRTRKYAVDVAIAQHFVPEGWQASIQTTKTGVSRTMRQTARAGHSLILTEMVRIATSLEGNNPSHTTHQKPLSFERIVQDHQVAWDRLWQTDIQIEGDDDTQQFARAALYYLWSSLREDDRWSIAPMGLSSNGYNGHIFWDTEFWMYPSLLVTQPKMAKSCLSYREHTVSAARDRAADGGYAGARFPWEGAFTGQEMTPFWAETRELQIHITADVAIAHWWYFLNTRDLSWLRDHGYPVMRECALFWASRVEYNEPQDRYEIRDVQCADEYAIGVDNDAFTNAAVQLCLRFTARAAQLLGEQVPAEWQTIAEKIYVPYDPETRRHVEHDGYNGETTKQADVELLTYPLEYVTDLDQIARDLDYYATVIDPDGPAMSYSVYSIVSAQLGRAAQAYEYLKRSYVPNTRPPFQSFSETPQNDSFHFCTGIGGALQAFLFGWTGLRLREDHCIVQPLLPPQWTALRLRNLFVNGARMDIDIEPKRVTLKRKLAGGAVVVTLESEPDPRIRIAWEDSDPAWSAATVRVHVGDAPIEASGDGEFRIPAASATEARVHIALDRDTLFDVSIRLPVRVPAR